MNHRQRILTRIWLGWIAEGLILLTGVTLMVAGTAWAYALVLTTNRPWWYAAIIAAAVFMILHEVVSSATYALTKPLIRLQGRPPLD